MKQLKQDRQHKLLKKEMKEAEEAKQKFDAMKKGTGLQVDRPCL